MFARSLFLAAAGALSVGAPSIHAQHRLGFSEDFALSEDRQQALQQLIPGTDDDYFFRCLHAQNEGRLEEVEPLLRTWVREHGRTGRVEEIETRQVLLRYDVDPERGLRELRDRLGLRFDHRKEDDRGGPRLPSSLDPELLSWSRLAERALQRHPRSLAGFEDRALERLVDRELDEGRLKEWLSRLRRPDVPGLVPLVLRDLARRGSRGFGEHPIHARLLLEQLEECAARRPELLADEDFVAAVLARLRPAEAEWDHDPAARRAHLERLEAFTRRLPRSMISLHAHVLHHRLQDDLRRGEFDETRFLEYLSLPRNASWVEPERARRLRGESLIDLGRSYPTGLDAVGDDEELVRDLFERRFRTQDDLSPYRALVRVRWLERVLAETRLLMGDEDRERWTALLADPGRYESLKDRVEIEFAPTQPLFLGPDDPVVLDVDLKNVPTLLVKVFEIDTANYYREEREEVRASLDLDGLVANHERTHRSEDPPLLRRRRSFEFPSIDHPGVFVVEFIGNGVSSRAIVRKGRLRLVERLGSAGHVLSVLDEEDRRLPEASVWVDGREFTADEDGEIVVPYGAQRTEQRRVVLQHGDRASLATLQHRRESYQLHAGFLLDRESLLPGATARLVVRPSLRIGDEAASVELLEDVVLRLSSTDLHGVSSTQDLRDFALSDTRDAVHEFQVPPDLARLTVSLFARVRHLAKGEDQALQSSPRTFSMNGIAATAQTATPLLGRSAAGYSLDLLGRSGEPLAGRALQLVLRHRDFQDPVELWMRTDDRGRIELGALPGISSVQVKGLPASLGAWPLVEARRSEPTVLRGVVGEALRLAYDGPDGPASAADVSLLELRADGVFVRDRRSHARVQDGALVLEGLPAGEYSLALRDRDRSFPVQVVEGSRRGDWLMGRSRALEATREEPLLLTSLRTDAGTLEIELRGADRDARVHVFRSRYLRGDEPYRHFAAPTERAPRERATPPPESSFHSGRLISDEYRYILDRRDARKYPGNMLARPGLLLNPWALEETETRRSMAGYGGRSLEDSMGAGGGAGGAYGGRRGGRSSIAPADFAQLDFLPGGSPLLANLRPDEQGRIRVPLEQLGTGSIVHVIAARRGQTLYATHAVEEQPLQPRDLRLRLALAPERHFGERRSVEFLDAGEEVEIADLATSALESYDSLRAVFQLLSSLNGSGELEAFSFLLDWPELEEERKRALYSEHACHELHFFLSRKDPAFFESVIRPHLRQKMDKTFLDRWLLDEDLGADLDPWAFGRLNVVERILLARRMEEHRDGVRRLVSDQAALLRGDVGSERARFETALLGSSLRGDKGLASKLAEARDELREAGRSGFAAPPRPSPAPGRDGAPPSADPAEPPAEAAAERLVEEEEVLEEPLDSPFDSRDLDRRESSRPLYRRPDRTRRYVEHNYWHRPIEEQDASLITVNRFWADFAAADPGQPFVSTHLTEPCSNVAEMMFALAVLDLPWESADHAFETEDTRGRLTAAGPLVLVRKELSETRGEAEQSPILVSQSFYRLDDRYRMEGNRPVQKSVSGEYLVDTVYGCQVVLTNPTATPRQLELLMQIPEGAIPVQRGFRTRGSTVELAAWGTEALEYHFYFPRPGAYSHYPAHVSRDGRLVAFVEPARFEVVRELVEVDRREWAFVSQHGSPEELYAALDRENLQRLDLSRIAWRMKDAAVYEGVIERLRRRMVYDMTLWSYSLYHADEPAMREYLRHCDALLDRCGAGLECGLVRIDPVERRDYQHVEFRPLINPRAHRFGADRVILNDSVARQYEAFLEVLAYRPRPDDRDWLAATVYLLLQDRVEEALESFAKVRRDRVGMDVQYDYLRAYLDFYSESPDTARRLAQAYREHPVEHWRRRFAEIASQLDEIDGRVAPEAGAERLAARQDGLAAAEPGLELRLEGADLELRHQNLQSAELRFYEMDVELLFSSSPFVQQGAGSFAHVRPNHRRQLRFAEGEEATAVAIPEALRHANVLVEVRAGGLSRRSARYANSLSVQTMEQYGQLRVRHAESGALLPRVYVKVYGRWPSGEVRFHKDGYTDLRGRFDYASISGEGPAPERFAILVLSEGEGAVIREVAPPLQ